MTCGAQPKGPTVGRHATEVEVDVVPSARPQRVEPLEHRAALAGVEQISNMYWNLKKY
ncbi:MAG: hypothetical protein U5R31_15285 [Acidimicrobiia bacterium]|nr:hypothetical protein [Acidimicrobiia bacterium]